MSKKGKLGQSGYTLVEVLVAASLGTMIALLSGSYYNRSTASISTSSTRQAAQAELETMLAAIRNSFLRRYGLATPPGAGIFDGVPDPSHSLPWAFDGITQPDPPQCSIATSPSPCSSLKLRSYNEALDGSPIEEDMYYTACDYGADHPPWNQEPVLLPEFDCTHNPGAPCCQGNRRPIVQLVNTPDISDSSSLTFKLIDSYPHSGTGIAAAICVRNIVTDCADNVPTDQVISVEAAIAYQTSNPRVFETVQKTVVLGTDDRSVGTNYKK